MSGFVYVLRAENGQIKFGYSKTPEKRIASLKTANAAACECLCFVPGTRAQEAAIHRALKPYRVRGEWYEPSDEVIAYVQQVSDRELPDVGSSTPNDASLDIDECKRAASIIAACGNLAGVYHYANIAEKFGVPHRALFKFLYRPGEPTIGEYLALMQGCLTAVDAARKILGDMEGFASKVLADHQTALDRIREIEGRLAALENSEAA